MISCSTLQNPQGWTKSFKALASLKSHGKDSNKWTKISRKWWWKMFWAFLTLCSFSYSSLSVLDIELIKSSKRSKETQGTTYGIHSIFMLCQILLTMVFIVSLTIRGLLLIWRGWLKRQQKNNLWAFNKGVSTRHFQYVTRVCDTCNIVCHSHTAQLSNYCSYFTFMTRLRWNFFKNWGILRSCTRCVFVWSISPSGSVVTSLVGVCKCGKAISTCGENVTSKKSKQQQKPIHTSLLALTSKQDSRFFIT